LNDVKNLVDFTGSVVDTWIYLSLIIVAGILVFAFVALRFAKSKKALTILLLFSIISCAAVGKFESSLYLGMLVSAPTLVIFSIALIVRYIKERRK